MLVCPFHHDMGGFESVNGKYSCGWCVDAVNQPIDMGDSSIDKLYGDI